ncbi:membrane protein, suppressor for copper-sensitivity A [Aeromonas molluscorum 848]|uniref:Membrane protein, suppressor for copper-sensitivity A n=1 Tax=Aeromonas molluscorum 848 TaxID=1268236 RepID=R1F953_9GAMM|nr:membrane protein, suppressor for copper-sensitivity A [Aeromonas molluscorum 848]
MCILLLNCAAQPLLKLAQLDQALSCQILASTDETGQSQESPQPSSCELKGKWLSAAQLAASELVFFVVALLIAVLAPLWRYSPPLPPPREGRAPKLRLHLQLCVLRE